MKILSLAILTILILFVVFKFVQSHSTLEPLPSGGENPQPKPVRAPVEKSRWTFYASQETKDYRVIVENNLFRPLGWKKEVVKPAAPAPKVEPEPIVETPPPPPTYTLILTGIVQRDSEWIAVVEDQKLREGRFIHRGERLKDGLVSEILPEHITLARGDAKVRMALGDALEYGVDGHLLFDTMTTAKLPRVEAGQRRLRRGVERSEMSDFSGGSSATQAPISSEARADGTDNQQTLIERMQARRRRELGQ